MQGHSRQTGHSGEYDKMWFKTWFTGGGNGKLMQYFCHENPMNSMKRQKYMTVEDESSRSEGVQYATKAPERMKQLGQSGNDAWLWICLVMEVKSDAAKNSIT